MSKRSDLAPGIAALALMTALAAAFAAAPVRAGEAPSVGQPVTEAELAGFTSIHPDGRGLPPGRGTVEAGRTVFAEQCASCHGAQLQGGPSVGAPALAGGRGSLTAVPPKKTVESYWPYATTLFDYVKRAMPFNAPGSLSDDQVYAVCAYILATDKVIGPDAVMDKDALAKVAMPNRGGFRPFPGPEVAKLR